MKPFFKDCDLYPRDARTNREPVVHLAFAVPLGATRARQVFDTALSLAHVPPLYRSGWDPLISWHHPIRAPHSITYNLVRAIRANGYGIRLYRFYEHTVAAMKPGDIFIGQPLPLGGLGETRGATDDPTGITSRTIREFPSERNFILMPYAHDEQYSGFLRGIVGENAKAGGGAIFIGGKIWERDWETRSPLAALGSLRKLYLPMAIDAAEYPLVKKKFNAKGKRRYLYIGHDAWYKNTAELERIAARMPEYDFAHIGGGEVKGWKKISNFATFTPEYMSRLAEKYDIFVNTSTTDPQTTTVLEQMCFGLAIACTPGSGHEYGSIMPLSTTDTEWNQKNLLELQFEKEEVLFERARQNRDSALRFHNWDGFTRALISFIKL